MKKQLPLLVVTWTLVAASELHAVAIPCAPSALARVLVDEGGLQVAEPRVSRLHRGDVLLQLNGQRLQTCAALERALEEAREHDLAVLLLVRRGEKTRAVAIESWQEQAAVEPPAPTPAASPTPIARTPSAAGATPVAVAPVAPTVAALEAAAPAGAGESVAARESIAEALRFGQTLREALPLSGTRPWANELARILRAHERRRASAPAAASVDPVFSYYATALEVVAYKEEATRDADSLARRAGTVFEYSSDSPVAAWLERYPFLGETVVARPERLRVITSAERPGRWMPDRAVELLVEHAIAQCEALDAGRIGSR